MRQVLAVSVFIGVAGCASVQPPQRDNLESAFSEVRDCARLYQQYDASIDEAGVRDSANYRIPGYPYLRIDRFLASFRAEAKADGKVFDAWLGRLKALAAEARYYELTNLPDPSAVSILGDKNLVAAKLDRCADRLALADVASPKRRDNLLARAQAPDEYSEVERTIGLYPLTRIPFFLGVKRWQQNTLEGFQQAKPEADSHILRYVPERDRLDPRAIQNLWEQLPTDALGIPRINPATLNQLFQTFAPVYEIETTGDYDRMGFLVWQGDVSPSVQPARPTVYRHLAFTRYRNKVLTQLVYSVWFSQRPASSSFDLLSGRLDGVIFRVTLDEQGRPLLYDSIHPCGCYHLFFPTDKLKVLPSPSQQEEWVFIPKNAPILGNSQRLVLSLESRNHYLVDIRADSGLTGMVYAFAEDDELRSLPDTELGGTRSAFDADGMIAGTERKERFLFWPMGIANPGGMRQWGKHATAFVGRRHFDDADLLEKRFEIDP